MVQAPPNSRTALRRRFTEELFAFLEEERGWLDLEIQPLLDELEAVISAGGKRLRPIFCYWGHRAAGGADGPPIIRAGAALEMLHTFAIVHDDVMDRSPMRRGRLSSFQVLAELARGIEHRGDPERFGVSAAVLAGDLALVLADRLLATTGFPADRMEAAGLLFDRMRVRAIAGQYLDLLAAHRGEADEATARRIGSLKAAGYTVADPLAIGATLAGANADVLEALEAYGRPLGEAFQVRDDVLGVFGDPERTGKDRDSDLREGKQTMLIARARATASDRDRRFLEERIGDPELEPEDGRRIREIILRTGALDASLELIGELTAEAKAALRPDATTPEARAALEALADEVSVRDA